MDDSENEFQINYFSGLNLRVKATLNHLNRDYLYLQLESVPHTIADDVSSNIILETGDMFKEIETKKFFRHKIVIMDQVMFLYESKTKKNYFSMNSFYAGNTNQRFDFTRISQY